MRHLFLLALLSCDWLGDPYFGRSPLSHIVGNQEVVCECFKDAEVALRRLDDLPAPAVHAVCTAEIVVAPAALSTWQRGLVESLQNLVYVFMAVLR
jgi:hypothetical protein